MPKFNPIFTFSKINLKLTKKSSRFIFSNYFIKKLLEFYIVSSQKDYIVSNLVLFYNKSAKQKSRESQKFSANGYFKVYSTC